MIWSYENDYQLPIYTKKIMVEIGLAEYFGMGEAIGIIDRFSFVSSNSFLARISINLGNVGITISLSIKREDMINNTSLILRNAGTI